MLYYKVPAWMDQKPLFYPVKQVKQNGFKYPAANGYFLIQNELLTAAECKRINAPIDKLQSVQIKKTNTYKAFGARFEI